MGPSHDPYAAFRVPGYRRYMLGWLMALVGTQIQSVAVRWEMYQRTGEALSLGLIGLAQALPVLLLALPAGFLADRFDRRRVVALSLLGMTVTSIGLALLSWFSGPILLMYALLILDASAVALGRPARTALLPHIVPRAVFPNAMTWNTSMFQISSVLGPAIGGFVVAFSLPAAYLASAVSSLCFIMMLSGVPIRRGRKTIGEASRAAFLAGWRFVWRTRVILTIISLDMFAVLFGGAVFLLPIFAEDILEVGPTGYGWLGAAPAAGALCMAILLAHLPPMRRAGRSLLFAVCGFGLATIIFGFSRSFILSLAMLFLTGAFDNISVVVRHTLVQLLTPDHMRGRVSAVNSVFIGASNELGGLESGIVAHFFGPIIAVVSGGIGTLLVVAVTALASPTLRAFGAMHEVKAVEDD
jgi:MFS family permease